ncbi:MAG: hypothetical protein KDH96_03735 [Candidatus Riesia sp.]|nr:hypothetical protein [Candidatus Riesia sp.]
MAILQFCKCTQCKYAMRNSKYAKYEMRMVSRRFRHKNKELLKQSKPTFDKISVPYLG